MPGTIPGNWNLIGRVQFKSTPDSIVLSGGYAVERRQWGDAEVSFRARAPQGTEQAQIWAGLRCKDRDSRYVFALRGGDDNDVYLARYAPDGESKFLGFAPLDFQPTPGAWYRLRAVTIGKRIQIYLNDEKLPRLNVVDEDALWTNGAVGLGGGWLPAEFSNVEVQPLSSEAKAAFLAVGNQCWSAPPVDKEALRQKERSAYTPAYLDYAARTNFSLDGNWLFMPDYELPVEEKPVAADYNDQAWHIMPVPQFWTPALSWLHGETGFPDLTGVSKTKGVADSWYVHETQRADSYTFDWRKTKAAWYRRDVYLPETSGWHFVLTFDAVAKVCQIFVNGTQVAAHTGLFGQIQCDATSLVHPGRNVLAVHVVSATDTSEKASNDVQGVAVTVEVTSKMLHSLPHGMLQDDVGGIWQPVTLRVSSPVFVDDCFIEPNLRGAEITLRVTNSTAKPAKLDVNYYLTSVGDNETLYSTLYSDQPKNRFELAPGKEGELRFTTPPLNPKLWTPEDPNLYLLTVQVFDTDNGANKDFYKTRFGFRTFTTDGSRLLLNGQPYWLRGGNPFPNTLQPNNAELARRFMQAAREGNVSVTRSHIVPFTKTWLDAADEIGMGVSFEGTWPWLMLRGQPPDTNLLQVWKDENLSLIRQYRNHPSLLFWTVNNEMKFESADQNDPDMLKRKWAILDDMIKAMRKEDSTRPIVADSSYVRKECSKGYQSIVKPNHFDDGDIDDGHRYYGWYNESFFHFFDDQYGRQAHTPGRPFISQEMSTGYPNNDDGHPTRFYLFKHQTPQALVGDDAWENADPAIFLKRQAFMTKELAEVFRRSSRETMAGILHFAYFTWLRKPWSADEMKPWPACDALKTALQPVLVSAELYGRHFYAGRTIHQRVCIANDSENRAAIPASRLTWEMTDGTNTLSSGSIEMPSVNYYENRWQNVGFTMPKELPAPRVDGKLLLKLEADGKVLSENSYDIVLATDEWAGRGMAVNPAVRVITGANGDPAEIAAFVRKGGHVLLLHPGSLLTKVFPEMIKGFKSKEGEIATMRAPESAVFSDLEPLDLSWFESDGRRVPIACSGIYTIDSSNTNITALAWQCDFHGYLQKPSDIEKYSGSPLVEIRFGNGVLIASEMCYEAGDEDPIARRLLSNMISSLEEK